MYYPNLRKKWSRFNRQKNKAWKVIKKVTGNRYGRGTEQILTKGIPQMVNDISYLKSVINSEKLRISVTPGGAQGVGQTSGAYLYDITPYPLQGDGISNRTGSSIKLHSSSIRFQISQQANTLTPIKLKILIVEIKGPTRSDTSTILSQMFLPNPFNSLIDFNSSRNSDYMKDFRVIRQVTYTLPLDPASLTTQTVVVEKRLGLKYKNRHIKFNQNGQVIASGQLYMIMLADVGNATGTVTSVTNVITNAVNTGCYVNYFVDHYYYDN